MVNRLLLIIAVCSLLAQFAHSFECTESSYNNFLSSQGRSYEQQKLKEEYNARFLVYCHNKEQIDSVNSRNLGYTLQQFRWMDRTEQELNNLIKLDIHPADIAAVQGSLQQNPELRKVSTVPGSVNYRTDSKVSSIKDQGSCGCCWSFTSVGLYESFMMYKGQSQHDLSQQYILECTTPYTKNVLKQNYQSTCGGGYVDFAGALVKINGVPLETTYPYKGLTFTGSPYPTTDGICQAKESYTYAQDPSKTTFSVYRNLTNAQMKQLIANGPVGAVVYANTGFTTYSSGTYSGCPSFTSSYGSINHAVIIVGYDASGNYIIKNSWGTSWGDSGFGVVSKDADCALSAWVYQYTSNAAPGGGLVYTNLISLQKGEYSFKTSIVLLAIFSMILLLI